MATFINGPAIAIRNSWYGSSGMRSSRATPPIGKSVTSGVDTPNARREDVPEFVRGHAGEQEHHEKEPEPGVLRAARSIVGNEDPAEEQQECNVHAHSGARDSADVQGPGHA